MELFTYPKMQFMTIAYYFYLILFLFSIIFLVRFLLKKNITVSFFAKALKNENSGFFEEAVINYESALSEEKKLWFQNIRLKNIITEKIKVLHTNIEYNNSLHMTR